jgi:hypothetical protein
MLPSLESWRVIALAYVHSFVHTRYVPHIHRCVCVCIHGFILCIIPRMRLQEIERGATQGTIGHRVCVCVFFKKRFLQMCVCFCCVCLCVEHTVKSISTALLLDKMRSPKVDHGPRTSVNPS